MPLNPNGMMCPFNGDISGVVAAAGRCSRGAAWLPHHRAQPLPWPSSRPSPTAPGLCSQAGRHLVNLIEGFVLSTPAHGLRGRVAWELAGILTQAGQPDLCSSRKLGFAKHGIINRCTGGVIKLGNKMWESRPWDESPGMGLIWSLMQTPRLACAPVLTRCVPSSSHFYQGAQPCCQR